MSKNDAKIKTLIAAVEKQKAEMGKRPKVSFETNGLFTCRDGSRLNLNTVGSVEVLVSALAELLQTQSAELGAAKLLGVDVTVKLNNQSADDWVADFKQQVAVIQWRDQKTKLDKLNKKLGKLMSEDARTANELEDIEKMLG
jgi:hypothetical protein